MRGSGQTSTRSARSSRSRTPTEAQLARSLLGTKEDGRIKLYVTYQTLQYRRQHPGLFAEGAYAPLEARGSRGEHAVAFGRILERETAIAVVPRFIARLRLPDAPVGPVWDGTWLELPAWTPNVYHNVLTGERVEVVTREGRPVLPLEAALATLSGGAPRHAGRTVNP